MERWKRFFAVALLVVGVAVLGGCKPSVDPKYGSVEGVVVNHATSSPISGASVVMSGANGSSSADGTFQFGKIEVGSHTVTVSAAGFQTAEQTVSVAENKSSEMRFELVASTVDPTCTGEAEPNDAFTTANAFDPNGCVSGRVGATIAGAHDAEDWFRIHVPANGVLKLTVSNKETSGSAGANVGTVTLLKADLTALVDNGGYTSPAATEAVGPIPVSGGADYYVQVKAHGTDIASYELDANFTASTIVDPGEPNGDKDHATPILSGSVTALIGYDDDAEDWYSVVPTGCTLKVVVTNLHPSEMKLGNVGLVQLLDNGLTQKATNGGYTSPNGQEQLGSGPVPVTAGQPYYIRVVRHSDKEAAPYRLDVIGS